MNQNPAFDFVVQALNDYAATLAPSARAGFTHHANSAAADLRAQLEELARLKAAKDAPPAD